MVKLKTRLLAIRFYSFEANVLAGILRLKGKQCEAKRVAEILPRSISQMHRIKHMTAPLSTATPDFMRYF